MQQCFSHVMNCEYTQFELHSYPDSKDHGANMGPTWVLSAPDGPHVGPMKLAIRVGLPVPVNAGPSATTLLTVGFILHKYVPYVFWFQQSSYLIPPLRGDRNIDKYLTEIPHTATLLPVWALHLGSQKVMMDCSLYMDRVFVWEMNYPAVAILLLSGMS